eukprot:CAMPEP_0184032230 /NCGR_PEP_ID=MMETSP0955-20130417/2866_1 /TAXON_ID=627963 /ORGANISM="Aplanochytrium sp, Strain PBS07" /LENGTH=701 /DNA_ID=CAMNT_0026318225 /DNA_START=117 /DNA_END=2222 /DNA_ORIENTATION=+
MAQQRSQPTLKHLFKDIDTGSEDAELLPGSAQQCTRTSKLVGSLVFCLGILAGFVLSSHVPTNPNSIFGLSVIDLDDDVVDSEFGKGMEHNIKYTDEVEDNGQVEQGLGYGKEDADMMSMDGFGDFVDIDLPLQNINAGKGKPKMVFFAGNAYSGHEVIESAVKKACDAEPGKCVSLCEGAIDMEIFHGTNIERYHPALERTEHKLQALAQEAKGSDKIYFANLYGNCAVSTTYPDLERSGKSFRSHFHPDVYLLASVAESTGWDLEIIVMLKNIEYVAERFVRDFDSYGILKKGLGSKTDVGVMRFMENGMQNLFAQVSMLHKNFYKCYDFDAAVDTASRPLEQAIGLRNIDEYVEAERGLMNGSAPPLKTGAKMFLRALKLIRQSMNRMCEHNGNSLTGLVEPELDGGNREISEIAAPLVGYGMPHRLKKTQFGKLRLVFFVGLEGTGHHLWQGIVMKLLKANQLNAECKMNDVIMHPAGGCWAPYNNGKGFFCSGASESFQDGYKMAADAMIRLKESNATGTHMLNLVHRGWKGNCGSLASYPCFSGSEKNLQHPDVLKLAELAENIGIDFRVVLLMRKAEELVISDIWHRHFNIGHPKMYEERVLENNAASIYTTIATMDPKFYSCTQYDDATFSTADHVGSLMQIPTLKETLQGIMHVRKANATVHLPKRHERYIQTLRAFNSAINELCSKSLGHV